MRIGSLILGHISTDSIRNGESAIEGTVFFSSFSGGAGRIGGSVISEGAVLRDDIGTSGFRAVEIDTGPTGIIGLSDTKLVIIGKICAACL